MFLENILGKWQSMSVKTKCDECGNEYKAKISTAQKQHKEFGLHQCRQCSSRRAGKKTAAKMAKTYSLWYSGDGNNAKKPGVGKKISERKSGVVFSKEHCQALMKPKSNCEKIKEAANRPEERERRSRRMVERLLSGQHNWSSRLHFITTKKSNGEIKCRSKLEVDFLKKLDFCAKVMEVESAEYLRLKYFANGAWKIYLPDFKITLNDGNVILVETKSTYYLEVKNKNVPEKMKALEEYALQQKWGSFLITERNMKEWLAQYS